MRREVVTTAEQSELISEFLLHSEDEPGCLLARRISYFQGLGGFFCESRALHSRPGLQPEDCAAGVSQRRQSLECVVDPAIQGNKRRPHVLPVTFPSEIFLPWEISQRCSGKIGIMPSAIRVTTDQPSDRAPYQNIGRRMGLA